MNDSANPIPAAPQSVEKVTYAARNALYWRRNLIVCVFGSFTTLVSLSMLLPFLPLYVEQLGVTSSATVVQWSGVSFGITFLGTALTAPIWGRLADRFGREPMLIRAAVGMAVVMSTIGLAHNIYELVTLRFAAGLVGGYASASIVMIGTQAPSERSGWALGVPSTGVLAGSLVGPLIGGLLPNLVGIRGTFFAAGSMISVAAVLTVVLVKEDFTPPPRRRACNVRKGAVAHARNYGAIAALLGTATMVLLANMSIEPIIRVYISQLGVPHHQLTTVAEIVTLGLLRYGCVADRMCGAEPFGKESLSVTSWQIDLRPGVSVFTIPISS
jgi:DHA1 family multidrug resistance protein-like MFS transporter